MTVIFAHFVHPMIASMCGRRADRVRDSTHPARVSAPSVHPCAAIFLPEFSEERALASR